MFPKTYFIIACIVAFSSWAASPSIGFQPANSEHIKPLTRPTLQALEETKISQLPYPAAQIIRACKSQFSDRPAAHNYCLCYATQSQLRMSELDFSVWSDILTHTTNGSAPDWADMTDQYNLDAKRLETFQAVNSTVNELCLPFRH